MASSEEGYATGADMIAYRDVRNLGRLLSDTGTPIADAAVATNETLEKLLLAASGDVELACQRGGRYTVADLEGLDGAAAEKLRELVCDLAFYKVSKRRHPDLSPEDVAGVLVAFETLKALEAGEIVFPTDGAIDAGVMSASTVSMNENCNRTVKKAGRFFGTHGG